MPQSVRGKSGSLTHFQEHQPLSRGKKSGTNENFNSLLWAGIRSFYAELADI
jgi:hypothetical protein